MNLKLQGAKKIAIFFAIVVYVGVSIYADVLFYHFVSRAFPPGFLLIVSVCGVFATGISVCVVLFAKFVWFSPGLQSIISWIFWAVEVCVLALNAILGYQIDSGHLDPVLLQWSFVAPASPLIAFVFWGILFLVDPSHLMRQAREELHAVQRQLYTDQLVKQARSVNIADALQHGAELSAQEVAEEITGRRLFRDTSIFIDNKNKNGHNASINIDTAKKKE